MDPRRTIEQLLEVIRSDPNDMRSRLRLGDIYARARDIPNALAMYEEVAKYYAFQGFALKAVAVYKQMCQMVVRDAPELRARYVHVPPILADQFERLGVHSLAVDALDALGPDPSSESHGPS